MDGIINSMDMSLSKLGDGEGQGSLECCRSWGLRDETVTKAQQAEHRIADAFRLPPV